MNAWRLFFTLALSMTTCVHAADLSHVVQKGHTLQAIAGRYKVTVQSIQEANRSLGKTLVPGMVLTIKGVPSTIWAREKRVELLAKEDKERKEKQAREIYMAKERARAAIAKSKEAETKAKEAVNDAALAKRDASPGNGGASGNLLASSIASKKGRFAALSKKDASGKHARVSFHLPPKTPGVIHVHRVATSESAALRVGKVASESTRRSIARLLRSMSGKEHPIEPKLIGLLAKVSDHFGSRQIEVISGFRPYRSTQFTKHSNHNHGKAVDFRIVGVPNEVLRDYCKTLHAVGVGYYPSSVFVHLDTRAANAFWIDYSKAGEKPRYHAPGVEADEGVGDVDEASTPGEGGEVAGAAMEPTPKESSNEGAASSGTDLKSVGEQVAADPLGTPPAKASTPAPDAPVE